MATRKLSERQQRALEAVSAASAVGMGISAYARANGLDPRWLHDAVNGLRKRGLLPATSRPRPRRSKPAFVAVNVVSARPAISASPRGGLVCRLIHGSGLVVECGEWPPAAWLARLMSDRRDASA